MTPADVPASRLDDRADDAPPPSALDRSDEGGDPACWADQFEDELYGDDAES